MWAAFRRVIRPRGAIVLTASQPFTSELVMSNREMFKYAWVWDKANHSNPFLADAQPLRTHEDVLVFAAETPTYFPQMRKGALDRKGGYSSRLWASGDKGTYNDAYYPVSVLRLPTGAKYGYLHPTQKPVALFAYLIRTYTRPGDLVLDPVCGSGTTAVAARETGRDYVCGDSSAEYVKIAQDRINAPYTPPLFVDDAPAPRGEQLSLMGDD